MKKAIKKIMTISLISLCTISSVQAAGVLLFAMKGPSIPKVMKLGQFFEKKEKTYGLTIMSEDPSIVTVTVNENSIILKALKPGKTTLVIKKNEKIKERRIIHVAYNKISEIPPYVQTGTKIYITGESKYKSHLHDNSIQTLSENAAINCIDNSENEKCVRIIKKRLQNTCFYEIKCIKPTEFELIQGETRHAIKIISNK
jgi:RecG-like helicase